MTHMHIPDFVLPVWLWVSGFIVMTAALWFSLRRLRSMDKKREIPLLGAISAAMIVAMSLEILPIAYHINLSVVAGILLGPSLGFVAAFIVNFMLALLGHGGVSVIGLNTILLGLEAVLGHTAFSLFRRVLPVFWRAAIATVLTLFITTMLLIAIVAASNVDPARFLHGDEHRPSMQEGPVSVSKFALLVLSFGVAGWIIEAAITGSVVKFISQVKPDLLSHKLHESADQGAKAGKDR
jgi:cobalt/nickel transport system permease protein